MRFSWHTGKTETGPGRRRRPLGKNINLPVLNNVLVKVDATSVQLVSTNLETAVRATMRGKTESFGEFTVPARLFLDYVNLLPDDQVEVELVKDAVKVTCRKSSTAIKGLPASEFPLIPEVERGAVLYLEAKSFKTP